jgi:hypothetical protein
MDMVDANSDASCPEVVVDFLLWTQRVHIDQEAVVAFYLDTKSTYRLDYPAPENVGVYWHWL